MSNYNRFGDINNLDLIGAVNPDWECSVCHNFLCNSKYSQFYCPDCDKFYHHKDCKRI